ncbi:PaaI family thioesterase [Ferrovibrio terrae]|uniref:Medium/long-chain acyl-CoA thioesterase YigI n=2 Tax=Ferrovibrio terrae TaxID=2594003 RepID=A0A516H7P9_9PROT|nr:PaaI family thioesterase [Ferrovibrio terrae]
MPTNIGTGEFKPADAGFEARVRDSFNRQPAMHLIGAVLATVKPGLCEVEMPRKPDVTQQHGFVHGGIVGMIADSAAGYAAYSLFPADATVLTVEYKMNLMAPADGDRMLARAQVTRHGRTLTIVAFDVFAEKSGKMLHCATGLATMMCMLGRPDAPRTAAS